MNIEGTCAPGFERVRDEFHRNFTERGEAGAAMAVFIRGESIVDLWGGLADIGSKRPWQRDTRACMMSVAKGVTALAVHRLAGEGVLDIDRTIAAYWPAFGANGKQAITLRQVLAHTAGVPYCEGVSRGGLYDWQRMTDALARQVPAFAPGSVRCYHSATMGFIAGEVVRRVTGRSVCAARCGLPDRLGCGGRGAMRHDGTFDREHPRYCEVAPRLPVRKDVVPDRGGRGLQLAGMAIKRNPVGQRSRHGSRCRQALQRGCKRTGVRHSRPHRSGRAACRNRRAVGWARAQHRLVLAPGSGLLSQLAAKPADGSESGDVRAFGRRWRTELWRSRHRLGFLLCAQPDAQWHRYWTASDAFDSRYVQCARQRAEVAGTTGPRSVGRGRVLKHDERLTLGDSPAFRSQGESVVVLGDHLRRCHWHWNCRRPEVSIQSHV